ncbi:hypothetical protein C0J52_16898 [Blattella germanica]|nr:hypothetical protein C0J52_16898 [Blattella germanica]
MKVIHEEREAYREWICHVFLMNMNMGLIFNSFGENNAPSTTSPVIMWSNMMSPAAFRMFRFKLQYLPDLATSDWRKCSCIGRRRPSSSDSSCNGTKSSRGEILALKMTHVQDDQVIQALRKRRPRSRLDTCLLHLDNAPAHRAHQTKGLLRRSGLTVLYYPFYSPDLAPCVILRLFPGVKVQQQLAQMGLRADQMQRALQQICQRTAVQVHRLPEDITMYMQSLLHLWDFYRQSRKWFDEERVDMVHKRKLAKMNWMRVPNEQNSEQLFSIRRETTRFLKIKKREYLKEKINDLEINAKNRNIRELYQGIRIESKGFQDRTNIIKIENGNMLTDAKISIIYVVQPLGRDGTLVSRGNRDHYERSKYSDNNHPFRPVGREYFKWKNDHQSSSLQRRMKNKQRFCYSYDNEERRQMVNYQQNNLRERYYYEEEAVLSRKVPSLGRSLIDRTELSLPEGENSIQRTQKYRNCTKTRYFKDTKCKLIHFVETNGNKSEKKQVSYVEKCAKSVNCNTNIISTKLQKTDSVEIDTKNVNKLTNSTKTKKQILSSNKSTNKNVETSSLYNVTTDTEVFKKHTDQDDASDKVLETIASAEKIVSDNLVPSEEGHSLPSDIKLMNSNTNIGPYQSVSLHQNCALTSKSEVKNKSVSNFSNAHCSGSEIRSPLSFESSEHKTLPSSDTAFESVLSSTSHCSEDRKRSLGIGSRIKETIIGTKVIPAIKELSKSDEKSQTLQTESEQFSEQSKNEQQNMTSKSLVNQLPENGADSVRIVGTPARATTTTNNSKVISKCLTDSVKKTSPQCYTTIDEYYNFKAKRSDKEVSSNTSSTYLGGSGFKTHCSSRTQSTNCNSKDLFKATSSNQNKRGEVKTLNSAVKSNFQQELDRISKPRGMVVGTSDFDVLDNKKRKENKTHQHVSKKKRGIGSESPLDKELAISEVKASKELAISEVSNPLNNPYSRIKEIPQVTNVTLKHGLLSVQRRSSTPASSSSDKFKRKRSHSYDGEQSNLFRQVDILKEDNAPISKVKKNVSKEESLAAISTALKEKEHKKVVPLDNNTQAKKFYSQSAPSQKNKLFVLKDRSKRTVPYYSDNLSTKKRKKIIDLFGEEDFEDPAIKELNKSDEKSQILQNESEQSSEQSKNEQQNMTSESLVNPLPKSIHQNKNTETLNKMADNECPSVIKSSLDCIPETIIGTKIIPAIKELSKSDEKSQTLQNELEQSSEQSKNEQQNVTSESIIGTKVIPAMKELSKSDEKSQTLQNELEQSSEQSKNEQQNMTSKSLVNPLPEKIHQNKNTEPLNKMADNKCPSVINSALDYIPETIIGTKIIPAIKELSKSDEKSRTLQTESEQSSEQSKNEQQNMTSKSLVNPLPENVHENARRLVPEVVKEKATINIPNSHVHENISTLCPLDNVPNLGKDNPMKNATFNNNNKHISSENERESTGPEILHSEQMTSNSEYQPPLESEITLSGLLRSGVEYFSTMIDSHITDKHKQLKMRGKQISDTSIDDQRPVPEVTREQVTENLDDIVANVGNCDFNTEENNSKQSKQIDNGNIDAAVIASHSFSQLQTREKRCISSKSKANSTNTIKANPTMSSEGESQSKIVIVNKHCDRISTESVDIMEIAIKPNDEPTMQNCKKPKEGARGQRDMPSLDDIGDKVICSPLNDCMPIDQDDVDIEVIGEFLPQLRTLSRDSGYTTPTTFAIKEDDNDVMLFEEETVKIEDHSENMNFYEINKFEDQESNQALSKDIKSCFETEEMELPSSSSDDTLYSRIKIEVKDWKEGHYLVCLGSCSDT